MRGRRRACGTEEPAAAPRLPGPPPAPRTLAHRPSRPALPPSCPEQEALRRNVPAVVLAEILPKRWSDFIRNSDIKNLDWGTRPAPQQRQPFAAQQPSAQAGPGAPNAYRSGTSKALYFGSEEVQQQLAEAQRAQREWRDKIPQQQQPDPQPDQP